MYPYSEVALKNNLVYFPFSLAKLLARNILIEGRSLQFVQFRRRSDLVSE